MASSFPFEIVGFDLDGTLVDSSLELAAALNCALVHGGRDPIASGDVKQLVGMGARHMLEMALARTGPVDALEVKALMPVLITYYEGNLGQNCPVFDGVVPALDSLAEAGVTLAVVTNKFEHLAKTLLKNIGLIDRFSTVIGGDSLGPGRSKPKPDPLFDMVQQCGNGRAAFVGDSIHDVSAARAAGYPCIAVSFGFLDRPAEALGADAVINHFDALVPTLRTLGNR